MENMFGQLSIFDYTREPLAVNKKIRLIELFAGIGSQAMALRNLGADFEHYRISEWEVNANRSYKAIHNGQTKTDYSKEIEKSKWIARILYEKGISVDGKTQLTLREIKNRGEKWCRKTYNEFRANKNIGSIVNAHALDLRIVDTDKYTYLMTYSFPCFTQDTLVLTNSGYKEIKDILVGDYVLTHHNTYEKVTASRMTGKKTVYKIKGMAMDEIKCTPEHKFYVRKMVKHYPTYDNGRRGRRREFLHPEWKCCHELDQTYYLGISINRNETLPKWDGIEITWRDGRKPRKFNHIKDIISNHSFWWLLGRYVGDGWAKKDDGIIISNNKKRAHDLFPHLRNCGFHYTVSESETTTNVIISSKELADFVKPFGKGAKNKEIPSFVFDLPIPLTQSFLDGYMSADGCYIESQQLYKAVSVSRKLIYGLAQLVAKAYETPYRIYHSKRAKTCVIEGRIVNQNDTYELVWKTHRKKQDKAFYEDGYIWFPIQSIEEYGIEDVYDISVENAHSFTANGVIVHNCQDLSVAGKQAGMSKDSGTRSGLLWEVERLLNECENLPQILLMENVPAIHSQANMPDFEKWIHFLAAKGYTNYWQDLNARDYGVAQNRNRCFMVSLLGDWNYKFPEPIPLAKTMKDYLEDEVDEKYYINTKKAEKLIDQLLKSGALDGAYNHADNEPEVLTCDLSLNRPFKTDIANCITAKENRGISNQKSMGNGVVETPQQQKNEPKCLNSKGGRGGIENIQPSIQDRVYSADGISTAITTCFMPSILEEPFLKKTKRQAETVSGNPETNPEKDSTFVGAEGIGGVYANDSEAFSAGLLPDISRTIKTENHDAGVAERIIVAMRGRNPDNPSDRTVGSPTEQRLEPNSQGICNTLTSVQKDNMVLENICINDRGFSEKEPQITRGTAPTLRAETHGNLPKIIEVEDKQNFSILQRPRGFNKGKEYKVCPPVTSNSFQENNLLKEHYRIRKLTPLECWRLMSFADADFHKAEKVNSSSQLYRQAGNSIVTAVIAAIMSQFNIKGIKPWNKMTDEERRNST